MEVKDHANLKYSNDEIVKDHHPEISVFSKFVIAINIEKTHLDRIV